MRIRKLLVVVGLVAVLAVGLLAGRALEKKGDPDPTSDPANTSSYTLEDIYNRLDTGAPGTPSTFTEPTSGPGTGTMRTLDEIMALAGTACTQCTGTLSAGGRWCDNDDGTVTDMTTGLVWLKNASWGEGKLWREEGDYLNNDDAHTRAGILKAGSAGANLSDDSVEGDWRLPTKTELYALANGTEPVRYDTPRVFTGVQAGDYWSSTTRADCLSHAYWVGFSDGYVDCGCASKDLYHNYVWPVRGG